MRDTDLMLLWARAAGRCCFPDCKIVLIENDALVGHAAHVIARSEAGPRGQDDSRYRVETYKNLILLCGHHHMIVDKNPGAYPHEMLRAWKAEHESWVRNRTEPRAAALRWTVIALEDQPAIDLTAAQAALGPGNKAGRIHRLSRPEEAEAKIAATLPEERRFAVFCLTNIPHAVQLGYRLGDRGRVQLYHYHRDPSTWAWPAEPPRQITQVTAAWSTASSGARKVILRVSLSASVPALKARDALDVHLQVSKPSVRWLRYESQLTQLASVYGEVLKQMRTKGVTRVHLFYAGPCAGAVLLGRLYNPRMNPPMDVYEYCRGSYRRALVLGE